MAENKIPNDPIFGAVATSVAILAGLIDQGAANREKMIDYLLQIVADLDEEERQTPYGKYVAHTISLLEQSQFPKAG